MLGMLAALFGPVAHAGEERYDYDALGRLVRVIDEQGRVTEYIYDPAGNILEVRVSGAGSAQPPAITTLQPTSIRRGETRSFEITGTNLAGAQVTVSDAGLDLSSVQVQPTQITFQLTATLAAVLGPAQVTLSSAAGTASAQLTVNPLLPRLGMSPLPIAVPPTGAGRSFFVTLSNADTVEHVVALASSNPAIATVSPASVTFEPGQTEKLVTVSGHAAGNAAINLASPLLVPNAVPVFVTAEFAGITTSFAPSLQVIKEDPAGPPTASFGPFASPLVGVVRGGYIAGVAPDRLTIGTGPIAIVVSGSGLGGVTGVSVSPPDGITVGAISVAPDGNSVSVPVTVAPDAARTPRTVVLAGSDAPYVPARPGADQFLVTLPPPHIDSITPLFATAGATAMTLTVRGRNLQSAQAVSLAPGTGITISNTPSVNADGTVLTVALSIAPLAPAGQHVVTVTTPGGTSSAAPAAANTFSVVNEVQDTHTPIASALLGVVKEDDTTPPAEARSAFSTHLGVVIPPVATGISPAVGIVGESVALTISGIGLDSVTSVQFSPPTGLTAGALSYAADGSSVTVPVSIASDAPQNLREVQLLAGASPVLFTVPAAALFRVSAPLPQFDSMTPIVLQAGAAPVTLTIRGRNFQNASLLRVSPSEGITVTAPAVNGSGTQASVTISAAAGAATGPRAVSLVTPAGEAPVGLAASNTLTVVNTIAGDVTPVTSAPLGVVVESETPPVQTSVGPFVSPALGVVLEEEVPAPQATVEATGVGIAKGAFATDVQVAPLVPTSAGTLVITGADLAEVTSVQVVPPDNITVGTLTIAPDGTQISAPLTLTDAAPGLRGVRVMRDAEPVPFIPPGGDTFRIGVGTPDMDSITPILESRGQSFTMILRGHNFQGVTAVTATPGTGIHVDNAPSANAAGTEVTVRVSIAADAPAGAHVFRVHTPGGATTDQAVPANTFTVLE